MAFQGHTDSLIYILCIKYQDVACKGHSDYSIHSIPFAYKIIIIVTIVITFIYKITKKQLLSMAIGDNM